MLISKQLDTQKACQINLIFKHLTMIMINVYLYSQFGVAKHPLAKTRA